MIGALITLLIYVIVLGIAYWVIDYVILNVPVPDPFARIARILMVVIFALILIGLLLNFVGVNTGLDLPRIG